MDSPRGGTERARPSQTLAQLKALRHGCDMPAGCNVFSKLRLTPSYSLAFSGLPGRYLHQLHGCCMVSTGLAPRTIVDTIANEFRWKMEAHAASIMPALDWNVTRTAAARIC